MENSKSLSQIFVKYIKIFVICLLVMIASLSAFLYFNFYITTGSGPAGPQVPAQPFSKIWGEQKIFLLGIGDSITNGFGAPKGYSYFDRLIKNPPDDCCDMKGENLSIVFPNLNSKNLAVPGTTSIQHLKVIQDLPVQPADVAGIIVITTGGNDIIHNYGRTPPKEGAMYGATLETAKPWIQNYKQRLDQMIIDINEKFPAGCQIFIGNIYDPTDGTGDTKKWLSGLPNWPDGLSILGEYNKIIAQCAQKHDNVHLVDIHKCFLGHGINCNKIWSKYYHFHDPHYWYYLNIEDPNPRGYDAIRRLFLLEMIKVYANN